MRPWVALRIASTRRVRADAPTTGPFFPIKNATSNRRVPCKNLLATGSVREAHDLSCQADHAAGTRSKAFQPTARGLFP
jgi:hypothetical protein